MKVCPLAAEVTNVGAWVGGWVERLDKKVPKTGWCTMVVRLHYPDSQNALGNIKSLKP